MILESLKYIRQEGECNEWAVKGKDGNPAVFDNINLIVGKNAAGKSRFLDATRTIATLLSLKQTTKELKFPLTKYTIVLKENNDRYSYSIVIDNKRIIEESLFVNEFEKYNRQEKKIYSEKLKKYINLTIADEVIITSLKDNTEDFPYISEIFEWSNALKKYVFTNQYEKNNLLKDNLIDLHLNYFNNSENIIQLFSQGKESFDKPFEDIIIQDLKHIGYDITHIELAKGVHGTGISVKEEELSNPTAQIDMSQGMFRALSFIIQLNLALLSKVSVCLLIDDLGEGLDFSRSKSLIGLLIHKIENSDIQMFITTNDRYIMNKIPLKYWSIVQRKPKSSVLHNYNNSKNIFEDFKYTGLSNFDFLATDFYLNGFKDEPEA